MPFQALSRVGYLQTIWRRQKELMFLALHILVEQILPTWVIKLGIIQKLLK